MSNDAAAQATAAANVSAKMENHICSGPACILASIDALNA
jgi:hypothetical protein